MVKLRGIIEQLMIENNGLRSQLKILKPQDKSLDQCQLINEADASDIKQEEDLTKQFSTTF